MIQILVRELLYRVGNPDRQRMVTRFTGILCLYSTEAKNRDDYICAPRMDSFSLEQAKRIGSQLQAGARIGNVDRLLWEIWPS